MTITRIIFLDMDGVISTRRAHTAQPQKRLPDRWIDQVAMQNLNHLCAKAEAVIVISSTWRLNHSAGEFLDILCRNGFSGTMHEDWRTISMDAQLRGGLWRSAMRGDEVAEWLSRHPEVEACVILDDDADFHPDQPLVRTEFEAGLNAAHVRLALEFLGVSNA